MSSNRFQRAIVISSHAKMRMVEREISEAMRLIPEIRATRTRPTCGRSRNSRNGTIICYVRYWYLKTAWSSKQSCTFSVL